MEPRLKTVIVPLDGSKAAEQALPLAAALANVFGACLDVVHVVDDLRAAVSDVEMEARRQPFLAYVADLAAAGHLPQGHWQARVDSGKDHPSKRGKHGRKRGTFGTSGTLQLRAGHRHRQSWPWWGLCDVHG